MFSACNSLVSAAFERERGSRPPVSEFNRQEWLIREVHVHETHLYGYLRHFLNAAPDIIDCIQETYARLLSLSDEDLARLRSPQAFLFTVARNVALEIRRKERLRSRHMSLLADLDFVADERPSVLEQLSKSEELQLLGQAIAALPDRCRTVFTMRKIHGIPQRTIASQLRISENTVEKHTRKGVEHCISFFNAVG